MKPRLRAPFFFARRLRSNRSAHLGWNPWGEISFYILGTPILRLIAHAVDNQQYYRLLSAFGPSRYGCSAKRARGLSGPSGPVKSYAVSFNTARQAVSCFLENEIADARIGKVRELDACAFCNGLCFEFALGSDSAGRPESVSLLGAKIRWGLPLAGNGASARR